jgi:hypothetical protein
LVHPRNQDSPYAVRAPWGRSAILAIVLAVAGGPAAAGAEERAEAKDAFQATGSAGEKVPPRSREAPPPAHAIPEASLAREPSSAASKAVPAPAAAGTPPGGSNARSASTPAAAEAPAAGAGRAASPLLSSSELEVSAEEKTAESKGLSRLVLAVSSMTLIQGRADPGQDRTVVPIVEQIGLSASDPGNSIVSDLKLCLSGWGRLDPVDESARLGKAADLDLGFVSMALLDRAVTVTLGRHLAFGGARRASQIDGLSAEATIFKGAGLSVFGGTPVVPRFASALGDVVFGGRVFYRPSPDAQVGASFFELLDHKSLARQEAGLDGRWMLGKVTLSGFGTFALTDGRLAEANLDAEIQASSSLWGHVNIGRTAPDLFISRTSIFSVFAADRRDEVGGGVSLRTPRWRILGEYHFVLYGADGTSAPRDGHEGLVKATCRTTPSTSLGAEARALLAPANGYLEGRLFATQRIAEVVALVLDLDAYHLQNPINGALSGNRNSYVASLSGTYDVAPGWLVALTGLASVTPFFEHRYEVLGKLVYNFSTRQEVRP